MIMCIDNTENSMDIVVRKRNTVISFIWPNCLPIKTLC